MPLGAGGRLGPYEVVRPLGAGGMGEVYLARDTRLGREVALKLLPAETADDPGRLARFEREARAVANLNHPNIVTLHAIERIDGRPVIVMERVTGRPLSALLEPGGLPLARILAIAVPIADAVAAAHEQGVVHRDLKPANVMLSDEGRVKLLDFGLAKLVTPPAGPDTAETTTATRSTDGSVVGTLPYMAPEQLRGGEVDARADLFSLGVLLYEMATGTRPFAGASPADLISAVLREEPAPLVARRADVHPSLARLVARCLEKDPRRRIQSATDLRQQLQDLADDVEAASRPPTAGSAAAPTEPPLPVAERAGRRRRAALGAIAGGVALAASAFWLLPRWRGPGSGPAPPPVIRSIAVLPLDNLARDASQDYFVDGLHEALITELAKLGSVRVTSRNSVLRYKGRSLAMKELARELGVDGVIEGTVLRAGNQVRVTAQLIHGASDTHVWAGSYDRGLEDVLALLSDVSRAVAGQVQARLAAGAAATPAPAVTPRVRPEAYDAYLRARQVASDADSPRAFPEALEHLKQAVALDPGLAPAWGALAMTAAAHAFFGIGPVADSLALARDAARKALAIDPHEGAACGALGFVELYFDWDFEAARADAERGVALNPHDAITRHVYADYLMVTGRLEESLEQVRLGRDANPGSSLAQMLVLFHASTVRDPEALRREARLAVERFPGLARMAHQLLGDRGWREGRYPEALSEYRLAMDPEAFQAFEATFRQAGPRAALLAHAGRRLARAEQQRDRPAWTAIAGLYAEAGDADTAFRLLEKAFAQRSPQLLHVVADPSFDGVRRDPRYAELLRRIGVPTADVATVG